MSLQSNKRAIPNDGFRSEPAIRMAKLCRDMGLVVEEEAAFPPYFVDIYLPEFHGAIEVDGPYHRRKADKHRTNVLWSEYRLPVMRVTAESVNNDPEGLKKEVEDFARVWSKGAEDRLTHYHAEWD